jgi:hypothetical protein
MRSMSLDNALVALDGAVSWSAHAEVDGLSDGELLAALRAQHRLVCRMQAERTRLISAVRSRDESTAAGWLRRELHLGDGAAQLRAAMVTELLPKVSGAFARGEISLAHVEVIAAVARDFTAGELIRADERLAEEAARLTPEALRRLAPRLRDQ